MRTRPLYDVIALLARIGIAAVFLAHGWQKIQVGITATSRSFADLGVPASTAAAIYATFTELLGGLALILGLGLPVAGVLLFVDMAGAFVFVHADQGIFLVDQGRAQHGFELVLVLGVASLLFAAGGGGRLSLDHHLFSQRTAAPTAKDAPQPAPPATTPAPQAAPEPAAAEPQPPKPRTRRASTKSRKKQTDTPDAEPSPADEPGADTQPRLASDIIGDTGSADVPVAGRRKPRGRSTT